MIQIRLQVATATHALPAILDGAAVTVDRQIRAFLNGDGDGNELLDALYGDVINEPVPERLREILALARQ